MKLCNSDWSHTISAENMISLTHTLCLSPSRSQNRLDIWSSESFGDTNA